MVKKRPRVLLVEDEAVIALETVASLKLRGYRAEFALNAADARRRVHLVPRIDAIIMDVDLGRGVSGIDCAAHIYREVRLPIVFRTSQTDSATIAKARHIKHFGFVEKAYPIERVIHSVDTALERDQHQVSAGEPSDRRDAVADLTGTIVFELDRNGRFGFVSSSIARHLGVPPGWVTGLHFSEHVAPESRATAEWMFRAVMEGSEVSWQRIEKCGRDGQRFVAEVSGQPRYSGNQIVAFDGVERILESAA